MSYKNKIIFFLIIFFGTCFHVAYGATIRDNPVSNVLPATDDGYVFSSLGFTVNFLSHSNSSLYVVNNGNIQFNATPPAFFDPAGLTSSNARQIIAPFFADVDTRSGNIVHYGSTQVDGHLAFIVNWPHVGYFDRGVDKLNTFQLVLIDRSDIGAGNFDIEFNYEGIQWDNADSGSLVRAGFSDGSLSSGTYHLIDGSAVTSAFLDTNLTTGLIYSSNIGIGGRFLFLARNGAIVVNPSVLESIAETPYQKAVAEQLDKWQVVTGGDFDNAITQINAMSSTDEKLNALERLGVSFVSSMADTSFLCAGAAYNRIGLHLDNLRNSGFENNVLRFQGDLYSDQENFKRGDLLGDDAESFSQVIDRLVGALAEAGVGEQKAALSDQAGYFVSVGGSLGTFKRTLNQIDAHYKSTGITNGFDFRFSEHFLLGTAFDYSAGDSTFGDSRGTMKTKSYSGVLYSTARLGAGGYCDLMTSFSKVFFDYERDINIGSINREADARTQGRQSGLKMTSGYDFKRKNLNAGPLVQVQYLDFFGSAYDETGEGNLLARVESQTARSLIASAGGRATFRADISWIQLFLNSRLTFEHEFKDNRRDVRLSFSGLPSIIYDAPLDGPDRDYWRMGIGLSGLIGDHFLLAIDYDTLLANDQTSQHRITGSCRFRF